MKIHTIIRSSFFTLLELLVVFFILSLGAALTGVKIRDIYRQQQFLSESQQILNKLIMAQDLMMIMDTDVTVYFDNDPKTKQLVMYLQVEKPLDASSRRLIESPTLFKSIQSLEPQNDTTGRSSFPIAIHFSLGNMSEGQLLFSGEDKKGGLFHKSHSFIIDLPGYPSSLHISSEESRPPLQERDRVGLSQKLYPVEVFQALYKDPHENQK